MLNRPITGIDVSDETIAHDLITHVGIGGNSLAEEHTATHFRDELWFPSLIERLNPSAWNDEKPDMLQAARAKAKAILASHDPRALTPEQEEALDAMVQQLYA